MLGSGTRASTRASHFAPGSMGGRPSRRDGYVFMRSPPETRMTSWAPGALRVRMARATRTYAQFFLGIGPSGVISSASEPTRCTLGPIQEITELTPHTFQRPAHAGRFRLATSPEHYTLSGNSRSHLPVNTATAFAVGGASTSWSVPLMVSFMVSSGRESRGSGSIASPNGSASSNQSYGWLRNHQRP